MPQYIVSVKKGLDEAAYEAAQQHARVQGGKIIDTFKREGIAPGFVVEFPKDSISTLESGPHVVGVEGNGEVTTQ
ncbi:hypothetical protein EG329_004104 [Mollisiaceae sp. DMI_Dod_QoI]|nr:hypothetical protein EG329_004104 [Helotiales sp. DMI_Dod_QoI]